MVRSKLVIAAASLSVFALGLSACGSSQTEAPASPAATTPSVPGIPANLVGMQVEGVEVEAWPSAPFGALRLWDNGTAWSQI